MNYLPACAQLRRVAISAYERIGAGSDERCEDRRVPGIARDFNRSRAQIDDFGPDVELAYELLDPPLGSRQVATPIPASLPAFRAASRVFTNAG